MITTDQYQYIYPNLAGFAQASKDSPTEDPSLVKSGVYLGGSAYAGKVGVDSGLTRLLGARLERHATSKDAAKKIISGGGYLDANKGVRKSMALLEDVPPELKEMYGENIQEFYSDKLKKSQGKNFISGHHPNKKTLKLIDGTELPISKSPLRDVLYRRAQGLMYRAQAEVDFRKYKTRAERARETAKNYRGAVIGTKGKTLFAPVTDSEVLNKFQPDADDPFALMTSSRVKVYGNRYKALLGHLKKNKLSQIAANPGRVAVGATILGGAGAIAYKLGKKGYAEIKAYKRNGKLVKGHKRKLVPSA